MTNSVRILWVDDDPTQVLSKIQYLEDNDYFVETATSVAECREELAGQAYDLVIVDVMMPPADDFDPARTKGGLTTGVELARWIKSNYPNLPIVGCSVGDEEAVSAWFRTHTGGFWLKSDLKPTKALLDKVKAVLGRERVNPRIFIVHGHNDVLTLRLKNYIQNVLKLGEPVVLREQPSLGRGIIEKFEDIAQDIELVFVLLTPDDHAFDPSIPTAFVRRARQNVIFELGYFYGTLGRRSGRIMLLYQGTLDIPSDILGVSYINVDNGIESAGDEIRRELRPWLNSTS